MSRMRSAGRNAGLFGAAVGVVAAGAAIGFAAERYAVGRSFRRPENAGPPEPYGSLRGRPHTVTTEDGVALHVEVDGPEDAPLTVLFCHGMALPMDSWYYQWRALRDDWRLVLWDQRGHGRSGRGARDRANIDQLGQDLHRVLDKMAPDGPVMLVGHSMGGMTVMALADQYPELFGDRITGVCLMSTSSGKLADVTLGLPALAGRFLNRVRPQLMDQVGKRADLVARGWNVGSDLAYVLTKKLGFSSDVPPELVLFAERLIRSTPVDLVAEFYPALDSHDKLAALPVLDKVAALVLVGEDDLLTPADHSRDIAAEVPGCELVVVPDGGHLTFLEHPDVVNTHLRELCARAVTVAGEAG